MNKTIESKVGDNIKVIRERGCDITRSAVAKIEVGQRHLYADEIILLKDILNVSYDDIFNI